MEEQKCGTCQFNRYDNDGSGIRQQGGFYCGNDNSDYCGCPTAYDDYCEEWEKKE